MTSKDENMHSPVSPGDTDEKHPAHDRGTFEEIAKCAAIGEISEYAVTIEGEEQTTWFVWLLVCCCTISGLLFGQFKASSFWPRVLMRCRTFRLRHRRYLRCTRDDQGRPRASCPLEWTKGEGFWMVRVSCIVGLIWCSTLQWYTGIHYLGDDVGCFIGWSRCRCHVRLDRSSTRPRDCRYHLHRWRHWTSCVSYRVEHGELPSLLPVSRTIRSISSS
jgi:hypothetical protein